MHKILKFQSLSTLFQRIVKHELISGSFYILVSSQASNLLALLLTLFLATKLTSRGDYSSFYSLLSVITLLSIPAQSLSTIIVQFATTYFTSGENAKAAKLYSTFIKVLSIFGLCLFILFLVLSNLIAQFLKIPDSNLVILSGIVVALSYINIVNIAFLQSLLKFGLVAFFTFFGTFLKVLFSVIFVYLGLRVGGVLFALIIMVAVPFVFSFIPIRFIVKGKKQKISIPIREIINYALPTAIGVVCLSSFISTDVILVKHFFPEFLADEYSGISLTGRIIYYFTMPIPMVMFPLLIKRISQGVAYKSLFQLALLLVLIPSVFLTGFYFFFPSFILWILRLTRFHAATGYVGLFGLYMSIFSLVNVLVMFFLSLKQTKVSYFVAIGAILQILGISFFHHNFYQVIGISILVIILLLIVLLLYYFGKYGKKNNS